MRTEAGPGAGPGVRAALYARVSTESQQARGTIGSQIAALRERLAAEGREVAGEFVDDGHSGARLDRPGLDALRDAAEAGAVSEVWCLSPDRLARNYAYQVVVLEELARCGVTVRFADAPTIDDDPQARLLTQVQGVIAEYERAKIAERNRRAKLWQALTPDTGIPHLDRQITATTTILQLSTSKTDYEHNFLKLFGKQRCLQLPSATPLLEAGSTGASE